MANISREEIGTLHDKVIVNLAKEDYLPLFEKDIKSYRKSVNIPGFRKGMVPAGVIRKMFGKELYADAVIKTAETQLRDYLVNEKLDIFGNPVFLNDENNAPKLDIQQPEDYQFLFEIGLKPEIQKAVPDDVAGVLYKVKVKPEDIDQRIDGFRSQFGEMKDVDAVEGPENIVYITVTEKDADGNAVEGGISNDTSIYVKLFEDAYQKQILGKKKDDTIEGALDQMISPESYPAVYQNLNLDPKKPEDTGKTVTITIDSVKTLEKEPLGEKLYKEAFPSKIINSEEEFRKAIEDDEQEYWNQAANNYMEHQLYHRLTETPIELPEDFLKKWMSSGADSKPMTEEEVAEQLPSFLEQLKWTLITNKIIKDNSLEVTTEEIKDDVKQELSRYLGPSNIDVNTESEWLDNYVNQVLKDYQQAQKRADRLIMTKVFDWIKTNIPVTEKEISQDDFKKLLEESEHHHHH